MQQRKAWKQNRNCNHPYHLVLLPSFLLFLYARYLLKKSIKKKITTIMNTAKNKYFIDTDKNSK